MGNRKIRFENGEYYHIFNRGVDKRDVFMSAEDSRRFLRGLQEFNTTNPIGSLNKNSFRKQKGEHNSTEQPLVELVTYCVNKNHYHLLVRQLVDGGVSKFMQKIGTGYTNYFNERGERTGALFQGKFKAVHITTNAQLLYVSVYINLNYLVHGYTRLDNGIIMSSWEEFTSLSADEMCCKQIILEQFGNDRNQYRIFAIAAITEIVERRKRMKSEKNPSPVLGEEFDS